MKRHLLFLRERFEESVAPFLEQQEDDYEYQIVQEKVI